jgi:glycosyltransferase involved in cell wall biosynthesis
VTRVSADAAQPPGDANGPRRELRVGIYGIVGPRATTGVGRHLQGLLGGLTQIGGDDEYLLYWSWRQPPPAGSPNLRLVRLPITAEWRACNHLFEALVLPSLAARHGVSVLHVPNTMPIVRRRGPTVVTLYDLTEFALSERVYRRGRHAYRRLASRLAARNADAVITTSESTKSDLVRHLAVDGARVRVIYPGVDHDRFRPLRIDAKRRADLTKSHRLPERFLLYVGKVQPRKNLVRVLQAFARLRTTHPDLHFVIAGSGGWMQRDVSATIDALGLASHVRFAGWVADLPALYCLAEILVFPSLYEGFGFPLLEAMACGTPIVTSNSSSLIEVAGDAASCIDPRSVDEIAGAVDALLVDPARREELRGKGLERARRFTWSRCARETLDCYRSLAGIDRDTGGGVTVTNAIAARNAASG